MRSQAAKKLIERDARAPNVPKVPDRGSLFHTLEGPQTLRHRLTQEFCWSL